MIYYLNRVHKYDNYLKKVILISPIDCVGRNKKRHNYVELMNGAKQNVQNGKR